MITKQTIRPELDILTKTTEATFHGRKVLLRVPSIFRSLFEQLKPYEEVFCQWELPTNFNALKNRVSEMEKAETMPILLTFCKIDVKNTNPKS